MGGTVSPSVSSISPNLGDPDGSIAVTITGTHFTGTTGVTIGGIAAISVVVTSDTTITCLTPAKAAGSYDIVVTTTAGSGTFAGGFEYWYPTQIATATPIVFDTEKGVTGSPVTAWSDQGSGSQTMTAAGGASPTYTTNAFGTRHGLTFDGVANAMTMTDQVFSNSTAFIVAKVSDATNNLWPLVAGVFGGVHALGYNRTSIAEYDADTATIYLSDACAVNDGTRRCFGITTAGISGDLKFYMNGAQVGATQTDTYGAGRGHFDRLCRLGSTFSAAVIGCVVFVPAVVTAPELSKLQTWAIGKFVT